MPLEEMVLVKWVIFRSMGSSEEMESRVFCRPAFFFVLNTFGFSKKMFDQLIKAGDMDRFLPLEGMNKIKRPFLTMISLQDPAHLAFLNQVLAGNFR